MLYALKPNRYMIGDNEYKKFKMRYKYHRSNRRLIEEINRMFIQFSHLPTDNLLSAHVQNTKYETLKLSINNPNEV